MVKTWKESPPSETLTPSELDPDDREDMAPPAACSNRERISQGIKIQYRSLGENRETERSR
jgi:hypothetical protein